MAQSTFFDALDNIESAGRFFVELTERLEDRQVTAGDNATRLAQELGVSIPPELGRDSIEIMEERDFAELLENPGTARAPVQVVVTYPSVAPSNPEAVERKFSRCFNKCETIKGVKICVKVCVTVDIGLGGVSGKLDATISVAF